MKGNMLFTLLSYKGIRPIVFRPLHFVLLRHKLESVARGSMIKCTVPLFGQCFLKCYLIQEGTPHFRQGHPRKVIWDLQNKAVDLILALVLCGLNFTSSFQVPDSRLLPQHLCIMNYKLSTK